MSEARLELKDCGKTIWWAPYSRDVKVLMTIKAPSGHTLALVKETNPGNVTDNHAKAIKAFMQVETGG